MAVDVTLWGDTAEKYGEEMMHQVKSVTIVCVCDNPVTLL
jgi:hypothetical protein